MKNRFALLSAMLALSILMLAGCATASGRVSATGPQRIVKNVIFFLADGTGPEAWPMARWVKGSPLAVDEILSGAIRTYCANSIITDSAPGATAYATGYKGSDKGISVGPWYVTLDAVKPGAFPAYVPMATLLEGAKLTGHAVGIVATSNVQHATPAAFSSHWQDRNNYNELAEQQVYQEMDVVLSGGWQYLLPKEEIGGKRWDGENLVDVLKAKGYSYITTRDELLNVKSGFVWGAFAPDAMAYDLDRAATAPQEPSLKEMTATAIKLLSESKKGQGKGFFLFVEGSKVDWAAHANDPAGAVYDLLAFDDAVRAALEFAKKDGDTMVVVVADHGTGGITIGTKEDKNYSQTDDGSLVVPMRKLKLSGEGVDRMLAGDSSEEKIRAVMAEWCGIDDLSAAELKILHDAVSAKSAVNTAVGAVISRRAGIGWTTGGHTGADVFLFAFGPGHPAGLMENTAVGRTVAAAMGFEFEEINPRLFVEAGAGFSAVGFETAIDMADPVNPVLVATKGEKTARLPLSKNLLLVNGKTIPLEGIVVLAEKLDKVYVPRQAIDVVSKELK